MGGLFNVPHRQHIGEPTSVTPVHGVEHRKLLIKKRVRAHLPDIHSIDVQCWLDWPNAKPQSSSVVALASPSLSEATLLLKL